MQQFKIRPGGFEEVRKKTLIRMIPFVIIIVIMAIVINTIIRKKEEADINILPFALPVLVFVLSSGVYSGISRLKKLLESYTLTIGNNLITRQQLNTPTISISFNDVTEIIKNNRNELIIKGKTSRQAIIVPAQIDNYGEIEEVLSKIKTVNTKSAEPIFIKYRTLFSLLTVGLMLTVYIAKNKILVTISALTLAALLLWSFYEIRTNKNIDNKTKQISWWVLLVLVSIISVMIFKLREY
jgi:hypothetical protein